MRQILTFRDILIITTIHGYQLKLCVQPQNILQGEFTVLALVLGHVFYDLTSSYKSKRTVMSPKWQRHATLLQNKTKIYVRSVEGLKLYVEQTSAWSSPPALSLVERCSGNILGAVCLAGFMVVSSPRKLRPCKEQLCLQGKKPHPTTTQDSYT